MLYIKINVLPGNTFEDVCKQALKFAKWGSMGVQFKFNGYRHMITPWSDIKNRVYTDGFKLKKGK
jgi:hypothetical protein